MKKLLLSVAIVTGLSIAAQAQNSYNQVGTTNGSSMKNASPAEKAKHQTMKAEKELSLTADQKAKWETATLERINANAPIREKMKGSTTPEERKSLHAQAKINNDKFTASVNDFLTAEQKIKFAQMKQEMKPGHKGQGRRGPGGMNRGN